MLTGLNMSKVKAHFNAIAHKYDDYKSKNWYYYQGIKSILAQIIFNPENSTILDIGCGTGEILNFLKPKKGVGIDISDNMITIAKNKYPQYSFITSTAAEFKTDLAFDYILLIDVIEHIENIEQAIETMAKLANQNTTLIFLAANTLWEPLLLVLEKLNLKMPEGPHYRINEHEFIKLLKTNGFKNFKTYTRLLLPKKIFCADLINNFFYRVPLLNKLGLINVIMATK